MARTTAPITVIAAPVKENNTTRKVLRSMRSGLCVRVARNRVSRRAKGLNGVRRSLAGDNQDPRPECEDRHDERQAVETEVGQTDEAGEDQPRAEQQHAETLLHP